jgi:hypothetical protein
MTPTWNFALNLLWNLYKKKDLGIPDKYRHALALYGKNNPAKDATPMFQGCESWSEEKDGVMEDTI